jgi:hypothetical protein
MLRGLSRPESLLERSTSTARQYFDFVTSDFLRLGERHYQLRHAGIPLLGAPTYMSLVEGFVEAALGLAGATAINQSWDKPEPAGKVHCVSIVTLRREISWR